MRSWWPSGRGGVRRVVAALLVAAAAAARVQRRGRGRARGVGVGSVVDPATGVPAERTGDRGPSRADLRARPGRPGAVSG